MVWEAARREASRLRGDYGTSDPYVIARTLGLSVLETYLPPGVSGMIVKEKGQDASIFIDESDVEGRRRFTCAHELGHFIERQNIALDDDFSFRDHRDNRGTDYDLHEFFADEFAGELLMPAAQFVRLEQQGLTTTSLASHFQVTAKAVEQRRRRLVKNPAQ
jgi:Zn-dependent peptidase ImmA (M78 family)